MKRFYPVLIAVVLCALANGCASSGIEKVPPDLQYEATPMFEQFDADRIVADAKKLLGYTGNVEVLKMSGELEDEDVIGLTGQLLEAHKQGKPVVCISRNVVFIGNAIERALKRFPKADLSGLKLVVAAPKPPSKILQNAVAKRNIQYLYLNVTPGGPYAPKPNR